MSTSWRGVRMRPTCSTWRGRWSTRRAANCCWRVRRRGLVAVGLRDPEDLLERIAAQVSPRVIEAPGRLDESRRQFDEYFEGERTTFELELDWTLSHGFRRDVLHELVRVPYGEVVTYAELARRADKPKAVRAVGSAMATNPLPVVVPCHRVVRTGGSLGNYGGGVEMKRWLLTMEGASAGLSFAVGTVAAGRLRAER